MYIILVVYNYFYHVPFKSTLAVVIVHLTVVDDAYF